MNQLFPQNLAPQTSAESAILRRSRQSMITLVALLAILTLAGLFIPIQGAVIGIGQLGVETRVKRIAHPTGGVIAAIRVRDGDRVKTGDLLLRLDTTVTGVRANLSGRTVDQLLAERTRLEAEREGSANLSFPAALSSRRDPSAREAITTESRLFALRRSEREGLRAQLQQRIVQLDNQIAGFSAQIASLRKQQRLIEPERIGVQELWDQGLVTIGRRNQLERTAADLEGSVASLQASIAQAGAKITETREQIIQLDQSARADAGRELSKLIATLNEQEMQKASAGDAFRRSDITAPYDGVVDKMAFAAVGDVVQPAETIMEIVPDKDRLIVEANVSPADIDQVKVGQLARVRFTAFAASATPELGGRVAFVAADRTTDRETGSSHFRVRVEIDRASLGQRRLALVAGMPVEVFISTGSRSMLSYLTKPLTDQFARSFRD